MYTYRRDRSGAQYSVLEANDEDDRKRETVCNLVMERFSFSSTLYSCKTRANTMNLGTLVEMILGFVIVVEQV